MFICRICASSVVGPKIYHGKEGKTGREMQVYSKILSIKFSILIHMQNIDFFFVFSFLNSCHEVLRVRRLLLESAQRWNGR